MQWKKNWDQLGLLMWKNLCLQKKLWKTSLFLIVYPLYFVVLLVIVRSRLQFVSRPAAVCHSFTVSSLSSRLVDPAGGNQWHLAYTPNTSLTNRILKQAAGLINMVTEADLAFDTEDDMIEHLKTASNVFGGIVFLFNGDTKLPRNITYKIRLRAELYAATFGLDDARKDTDRLTDHTYPSMPTAGPGQQNDMCGENKTGHFYEGFLAVQQAMDLTIIKEVNGEFDVNRFELRLKQYPHQSDEFDLFVSQFGSWFPAFIMFGFMTTGYYLCKDILLEKEKKLKESMRLMGMKSWIYWCSWLLKSVTIVTISVITITFLLHFKTANGAVINYTFLPITFVFLLLYTLALVTFIFAVTTLFSNAITGSSAMFLIFAIMAFPYCFIDKNLSLARKLAASLDYNLAFAFGCNQIFQFEKIGIGVQLSNLAKQFSTDDSWTMLYSIGMLVVDIILHSIITWYLDAVLPGDIGTPQPFYFPLMRSYWCGGRYNIEVPENNDDNVNGSLSGLLSSDREEHFEKPLADAKIGIKIRGLTKKFKTNSTLAVNDLNIDIYEGNITALVGQNGAGKTTTMFMLTGFLPPTNGSAYINGMNIKYEMDTIRQSLGLCPQHDVLFDWLTVREHLIFFAKLKGCPSWEAENKVSEMIKMLHLEDKAGVDAKLLSGGLKRKLCVGIALIADSKVVILDEPTSGMDPEARRQTWDVLQSQQKGRTIVLSTHYMDEADQLGDRIAIMADGQIQCYGTPMFLKNKYGIGYRVTIFKKTSCNVDDLTKIIKSHVPNAQMVTHAGAEISFVLPRDQCHVFEELFARLEEDQEKLGIDSFGVSVTSMEEVFLKVGQSRIDRKVQDSSEISVFGGGQDSVLDGGQDSAFVTEFRNEAGGKRHYLQFLGLFVKRIIYSWRNWNIVLWPLLFFIALVLYTLWNLIVFQEVEDHPPTYLNLGHFSNPIAPFEVVRQPSIRDNGDNETTKIANCYAEVAAIGGSVIYLNNKLNNDTVGSFLLSVATSSIGQSNANYLTGATIETRESTNGIMTITGWFNKAFSPAIAISLSQITNTLMQCFGHKEYHIETINHPLPWIHKSQVNDVKRIALENDFSIKYVLPYALQIFIATFPISLIKERMSGSKHVQLVSGAKLFNFWFATFLGDFLTFLIPVAVTIIILESVHLSPYTEGSAIWFVILNFIFYGFSVIPFVYVLSFLFQVPSTGNWCITLILVISSAVSTLVPLIVGFYNANSAKALEWVFYITLPNFCFEKAFREFYPLQACSRLFDQFNQSTSCLPTRQNIEINHCCSGAINYVAWEYPGIGRSLFFMAIQGIVFFLVLMLIDTGAISLFVHKRKRFQLRAEIRNEEIELGNELADSQDTDVLCERDRVVNMPIADLSKSNLVIMQELTKVYNDLIAVDKLGLGISSGECFGLLGVNGAGKTTCFKILMGELMPSSGNAFISGRSVWGKTSKVYPYVGYCPQADCLIDQLTVRETLWIFACIRGVPDEKRNQTVDAMIESLMLKESTSKQTKILSGGNKRKLSVAIALIGEAQIIFLDEPTTGMDPVTRRSVWNTLIEVRRSGRTLILTSHSMEECEALCTRIAIMVNGKFQCLGSIQHLKDKFTEGYTLIIKIGGTSNAEDDLKKVNEIKSFVSSTFPGSILKDHHEGLLHYQIYTSDVSWSHIFGTTERAKHHLQIEDYSVSQTTLEQVFIHFARMQHTSCNGAVRE